MILLDTHVLLWAASDRERIGAGTHERIDAAIKLGEATLSVMSLFEIAVLRRKGRIGIARPLLTWLGSIGEGLRIIPVDLDIAVDASSLDNAIHGDPIDRILMATARMLDCPLVTADRAILRYAAAGHLHAVDARL